MEAILEHKDEILEDNIGKIVISNKMKKDLEFNKIAISLKEEKDKTFYQIEKFTLLYLKQF